MHLQPPRLAFTGEPRFLQSKLAEQIWIELCDESSCLPGDRIEGRKHASELPCLAGYAERTRYTYLMSVVRAVWREGLETGEPQVMRVAGRYALTGGPGCPV